MRMPESRGPITAELIEELRRPPHPFPLRWAVGRPGDSCARAALHDEDLQLALFICYELHYRGFDDVDERWEWDPSLLALRARAERCLEEALRALVPPTDPVRAQDVPRALVDLVAAADGPPLSRFVQQRASLTQFREFVMHRSIYHLKEADPHSWGIPRLGGRAKAALVEIQFDEYGNGRVERMHSELFRATMRGLDLDDGYGTYLDVVPAITLAVSNVMSFFGLHRRWRGALAGHLAAFEMSSSMPNQRYGTGLRRLGGDVVACRFYDEHVVADAMHEQVAAHDLCGGLVAEEQGRAPDVFFGAGCGLALDRLFAEHLLGCWQRGVSSLRQLEVDATSA